MNILSELIHYLNKTKFDYELEWKNVSRQLTDVILGRQYLSS